ENWMYALQDAPDAKRTQRLLADVDVYKVGHHGSLNATPRKMLWEKFKNRTTADKKKLTTMMSTMKGKHGRPASHTEVPRETLVTTMQHESELLSTLGKTIKSTDPVPMVLHVVKP